LLRFALSNTFKFRINIPFSRIGAAVVVVTVVTVVGVGVVVVVGGLVGGLVGGEVGGAVGAEVDPPATVKLTVKLCEIPLPPVILTVPVCVPAARFELGRMVNVRFAPTAIPSRSNAVFPSVVNPAASAIVSEPVG